MRKKKESGVKHQCSPTCLTLPWFYLEEWLGAAAYGERCAAAFSACAAKRASGIYRDKFWWKTEQLELQFDKTLTQHYLARSVNTDAYICDEQEASFMKLNPSWIFVKSYFCHLFELLFSHFAAGQGYKHCFCSLHLSSQLNVWQNV